MTVCPEETGEVQHIGEVSLDPLGTTSHPTPGQAEIIRAVNEAERHRDGSENEHGDPLPVPDVPQNDAVTPHGQAGDPHDTCGTPVERLRKTPAVAGKPPTGKNQIETEHCDEQQEYAGTEYRQWQRRKKYHRHCHGVYPARQYVIASALCGDYGYNGSQQGN